MQQPLFTPDADWRPAPVSTLPSWNNAKRVAVDVETCDPTLKKMGPGVRRGAYIAGISFAIEDGPSAYLPIRHSEDNLPVGAVLSYMRHQADSFTGTISGANLSYDLDFLAEEKIVFRRASWFRDCQIAEPLLDELQDSYSLEAIAGRWGIPGKDESLLQNALQAYFPRVPVKQRKGLLYKLPARYVGPYAIQDANLPNILLRKQEAKIDDEEIQDVYNLESRLLPILVKMRRRGVAIDLKALGKVEDWSMAEEAKSLRKVRDETGVDIKVGDVWKAGPLAKALEKIGVEVPKTPKTQKPSVDKHLLASIDHPVAQELDRARKVNKLRTTFAASVREHMVNGRIHCTFNQLRKTKDDDSGDSQGARYGRLSSCDPNLQQQPARGEFAKLWRSIYKPDEGKIWSANDYSQQEPRILIHFAMLDGCRGAQQVGQLYIDNPNTDHHTAMAQAIAGMGSDWIPSKIERDRAKIIFLGLCYSMGGAKLAKSLGLPTEWKQLGEGKWVEIAGKEAQIILDEFDRRLPFVKQLAGKVQDVALERGYIRTLSGRRCHFPVLPRPEMRRVRGRMREVKYDWTQKALNRLIQGSAADQTKIAMVRADAAGYPLQLQVHDELDLSVGGRHEAEALADIMRKCIELQVPSKVDVEVGKSWGEAA